MKSFEEKFWTKVDKNGPYPKQMEHLGRCWVWLGSKSKEGRARFGYFGKNRHAARVLWLETNGEIANGMEVCHKCDNPSCVNPDHLFLGTHMENMQDMIKKNRSSRSPKTIGETHGMSKLTEAQVIELRTRTFKNGDLTTLSKQWGISDAAISMARRRITWKHILIESNSIRKHSRIPKEVKEDVAQMLRNGNTHRVIRDKFKIGMGAINQISKAIGVHNPKHGRREVVAH